MNNDLKLKKKAAFISLFVGIGMFISKITAFLITDSSAIFSDAAESVVHIMATIMAVYSIIVSARPADKNHLYGHGNIEYFSAGVEGILIIIAAITIIYAAILSLISGSQPHQLDIGVYVIVMAGIINLALGLYLVKTGKQTNSIALIADGKHVLTDSYTSIGVVVGLGLVLITGEYILDPIIAVLIALNILYTGFSLIRKSIGGLMMETDKDTLNLITKILANNRKDFWIDIHQLRFWKSADKVFVDFHLILPFYFEIKVSHTEEEYIRDLLLEEIPNLALTVHMDYCKPFYCEFCNYTKCDKRSEEFNKLMDWNSDNLIGRPIKVKRKSGEV